MPIKAIARQLGVARNTVRAALAADAPPVYRREPGGSAVDEFEPAIRELLKAYPTMPATVIAQRVGWTGSSSVLRAGVAALRPLYAPADPADRTQYAAGEIVQCDLWFPPKQVPVSEGGPVVELPVLTMVAAWSGFLMALMLPSRTTSDLLLGMWHLLSNELNAVPRTLVWDNEAGIGRGRKLTVPARSFAGTLGTRIYQTRPFDPQAKGVVERGNGFQRSSFLPGREFTGPSDFNDQLAAWLITANQRTVRRIGARPADRIEAERAAMMPLPPVPPVVGYTTRVRLGRDYYVRVASNDYSVDPGVIGRFVDVRADLSTVTICCAGQVVGAHQRSPGHPLHHHRSGARGRCCGDPRAVPATRSDSPCASQRA
ncbi:IS21 family transposase [Janibacter limosus]|uniref:IS21 family transposase n=1 Tax=Janibacter limosus TaxID=53458 RepID=A0AC61U2U7_9MICO|nr:IS21 family transposase [Janibacter limosus]UUZ44321.1 IS21 family transposase [Janibacter limosus]